MRKYLQSILLILFVLTTQAFMAQKLYWVGGSGNFNDPAHWSLQSGGKGGAKTPTATDDVYFDENSFLGKSVVNFVGTAEVHDFIFAKYTPNIIFTGLQNEKITINGDVQLNSYIDNQFEGDVWFTSNKTSTSVIFELTKFKGNVYFNGNTQWQMQGDIATTANATVYFKKGTYNLTNAAIYTDNLIASPQVTINSKEASFRITNKFVLPAGVIFNDVKSNIYARIKDVAKYQVDPTIHFSSSTRLHNYNSVSTACNITLINASPPSCVGNCDGFIVFQIPAATCAGSDSIVAIWTSNGSSGNTNVATAIFLPGTTPATYSVTGLCGSSNQYAVDFVSGTNELASQDTIYNTFGISLSNPAPPVILSLVAVSQPSCFGLCDGSLSMGIKPNSGQAPLSSTWTLPNATVTTHTNLSNAAGNHDILSGACAGTYSVFITDKKGCKSATTTITLSQPTVVSHTVTTTNILCNGVCNGNIAEDLSGGTAPYTFTWSPVIASNTVTTASPNSTFSGLCAGTYTVRTKDAHGCKDSATATVTQPPALTITAVPASGTLTLACNNVCNASLNISSVTGGTSPYTFSWTPAGAGTVISGATSSTYSNVCGTIAGTTYTCTITDANGCVRTRTFTVTAPPAITHTLTATNPKCNAGATGSATVTEAGGTGAFTFTWSPSGGTVTSTSPKSIDANIGGGTYTVYATDVNGCKDSASITLTPPSVLTATLTTITNPTCPNLNNGQLCVTAGGGTSPYTYSWTPAAGTASCTPATLVSGNYMATVTDANSCTVTASASLVPPPTITVTAAVTQPTCAGLSNGSATLTASGGNGVFTYQWSCSATTSSVVTGQAGGTTCSYTVTDGNNCRQTGSVTFNALTPLTLSLTPTALSCAGGCNAQITTNVGGGIGGTPNYSWTGTGLNAVCGTCANQTNMCAGSYTCTITDANGCTKTATTSIASPTPISITLTPTNPTCNGSCNGSISSNVSGGTGTYTLSWAPALPAPNPPNTPNPNSLCANTYTLNVTDANSCLTSSVVTITDPTSVTFTLTTTDVLCAGQSTGTASVTASGGTPGYTYSWDGGAYGPITSQTTLAAGTHSVVVKDSKGCVSATQFFTINQPTALTSAVTNVISTCNGLCNGGATANVSGGTPGYEYSWDVAAGPYTSGAISVNNLCVGSHTLYVKDTNNCTSGISFAINPLVNISISASSTSVSCHNLCDGTATASAAGGVGNYTISWSGSNTCNNVPPSSPCTGTNLCGTVTVTATDASGCSNTTTLTIANPPALTASTNTTSVQCFGMCTGTATLTPSGGTPTAVSPFYNITWSPAVAGTTSLSNLCPGTYTATILDQNACSLTQTLTIGVSNQFTVTPTITPPSTCGANDASISLAISGGSGTYTVNWMPGNVNANPLTNIGAGTYTANINDANGCDTTIVYGVSNLTGPTTTVTINNNVSCPGVCDGSATVSGSGNGAITVAWPAPNPTGASPQTGTSLCGSVAGVTTFVNVTDAVGCVTVATVTITAPPTIQDNSAVVQPGCNGTLGSITLNPTGGNGGSYSFSWNGGAFTVGNNALTNLSAGTYSCVIKDVSGCTSQTFTYSINTPNTLTLTVSTGSTTCSYSKNGTATATASGGVPAYTYTWTNSSGVVIAQGTGISNVSSLAPGVYTVAVTDASSCSLQTTFTVSAPAVINPNFVKHDNLCSTGTTGSATVAPTGGTSPYTYQWNTASNPITPTVSSVSPGNYFVIVYDANLCSDTTNFTISAPNTMSISVATTNPTCFGYTNGSATVTVTGGTPYTAVGTPAYTYSWSPISCNTCTVVTNLGINNNPYSAIALDSNGCSVATTFTLTEPSAVSANTTVVKPNCVGDCNGSITANPTGGTGSYTYQWTPAAPANPSNNNLCAGNYTLIVTDANNCRDTSNIAIANPTALSLIYSSTPATCGQVPCNGSIIINSANGNGAVTVVWVNPPTCTNSYTCNTLCAGIYSVKLTDSNGCTDTLPATVSNSNGPVVATAQTDVNCAGSCNGTASVTVTSGSNPPYTFTWNSPPTVGSVVNTATTSIASNLCDSSYISVVTDNIGCKTITTFSIGTAQPIQDNPTITSATCLGINNGSIISMGSGGSPFVSGYSYSIDNGAFSGTATSFTFTSLSAGTHTVTIKDSVNCSNSFVYTIPPNSAIVSNIAATNVNCFSNCNGTATVSNINGGAAPYTISWNDPNNQTGTTAINLCAGTYTATITDNAGCMALDTISVISPSSINPNTVVTNPTCGQCDGSISIAPTGGNGGAYTYTWSPSGNSTSLTNVCAGPYQVNIADNAGCMQTFLIPVSSSNSPTITVTSTNLSCGGVCNGSVTTTVSGGITPYTYLWPLGGQTTSSIINQCAGNYFVQVKDSVGCIATQSVTITAPAQFTVTYSSIAPNCNLSDGTITTTVTGSSGYSYQWSANAGSATTSSVTNVSAGIYTVVVTDTVTTCSQTVTINLSDNSGATLVTSYTNTSCFGTCDGVASVTASFGTPPIYSYTWSPSGGNNPTATGLCAQPYSILVSDGSGCIQIAQVTISEPTKLIASLPTVTPLNCNGDCNGALNTVIFGGTPAYTYSWSTSAASTNITNLCAGNYSLMVTDANNCMVTEFDTISSPPVLATTFTITPATCSNSADGAITTITTGGNPTYTYQWSGGSTATTPSLTSILPGTYTLVATDTKSCKDTTNFTVASGISLVVNAGRDTALCSNAPVVLTGTVTGAASFGWQDITGTPIPPANTLTLSVNPPTTTQYVLMAVNGPCTDDDTITVTVNPLPVANAGASQYIFTGQTATIGGNPSNPNGGTIVWMPNTALSDTSISNPISATQVTTTYTLMVTNASGCVATDTMMVVILPPIVINNGFTPNGDGKNDTWVLDELFKFPNAEVEIYNRWGEQLFYSKGNYNPWNGMYKGQPLPVGTYYYIIRLNDKNFPDHYAGPLTILR